MLASIELTLRTTKTVCKYFLYAITVSFVISPSLAYTANAFTSRIYFSIVAALLSPNTRYFFEFSNYFCRNNSFFHRVYLRVFSNILLEKYKKQKLPPLIKSSGNNRMRRSASEHVCRLRFRCFTKIITNIRTR